MSFFSYTNQTQTMNSYKEISILIVMISCYRYLSLMILFDDSSYKHCSCEMNGNSRYLPRLNLCYLQKKAYEIHLKKMSTIQNRSRQAYRQYTEIPDSNQKRFASITGNRMSTIKQRSQKTLMKMSPYQKKIQEQTQRENMRLYQAIQKCPSTISRKVISQHKYLNQQFRQRICKFAVVPGSKRTLLKCQISLDKMNKRQKQSRLFTYNNDSSQKMQSRVRKQVKSQSTQSRKFFKTLDSQRAIDESQALILNRNKNKINKHFERSEISLRTRQKLQGFRQSIDKNKKMHSSQIYKWKTRCFTTQMESHSDQHR